LGAFASGSLLIAVSPQDSNLALETLASANIPAARIGKMVGRDKGLNLVKDGEILPLPIFHQDELSKIFG
jgi:hydrogenase maturation factor